MRPQWETGVGSGGQVKAAAAFPKENNPSSVFSSFSFAFSHLYFSYTPFHLPASPSCFLLCTYPSSALPRCSLQTPDTAHMPSFVCPYVSFYYWVKCQIHTWSPFDDSSACMLMCRCVAICG